MANINKKVVIRYPNVLKRNEKQINAIIKLIGFVKFSQPIESSPSSSFDEPIIPLIKTNEEREKRRIEAKNGINPGPGFPKSPTPNLRLEEKINTESPIKKRLPIRSIHFFISLSYSFRFATFND
jgi:hypothetical protein